MSQINHTGSVIILYRGSLESIDNEQEEFTEDIRRHELKYYISYFVPSLKSKIRHVMEVDRNAYVNGEYEIISLYFDDIYNSAFREKISGTNNRTKYRIRIYNFSDNVIKLQKEGQKRGSHSKKVSRIISGTNMKR